ncbi:MAG: hypothetical protein HYZ24_01530 [Chloroflexi bacterium]|nr:hypothetical protein [Chloroflexota bacterium]
MNRRSMRFMPLVLFAFSLLALACNAVTNFTELPTPIPPVVSTGGGDSPPLATQQSGNMPSTVAPTESGGFSFGTDGAPKDIPILPDATNMLASPSAIIYTTQHSKDDASQFYMDEMKKLGWTFVPAGSLNGDVANIMNFAMGAKTAMIMVGTATGEVKVQITYTE